MSEANEVRLEGAHCALAIGRPAPRIVTIVFEGTDVGDLGDAPFRELGNDLSQPGAVQLFIDAQNASGASIEVSGKWAAWLNESEFLQMGLFAAPPMPRDRLDALEKRDDAVRKQRSPEAPSEASNAELPKDQRRVGKDMTGGDDTDHDGSPAQSRID